MEEINRLRSDYEARIEKLNEELAVAAARRDTVTIERVLTEKDHLHRNLSVVAEKEKQALVDSVAPAVVAKPGQVVLTKAQFDALVARVLEQVKAENAATLRTQDVTTSTLSDFDKLLLVQALGNSQYRSALPLVDPVQLQAQIQPTTAATTATDAKTQALLEKMTQALDKVEASNAELRKQNEDLKKQVTNLGQVQEEILDAQDKKQTQVIELRDGTAVTPSYYNAGTSYATTGSAYTTTTGVADPYTAARVAQRTTGLKLNRFALFTGPNFGDAFNWNIGLRSYLQISNTRFDFVPEAFIGIGSDTGFGLGGNVLYNIKTGLKSTIDPYVGLGLGYTHIGGESRFAPNFVVGAYIRSILGGRFFVDYTARGLFKNNQFAAGYSFIF